MGVTLTVYFNDPFWVGVFERMEDVRLSVCKVTFGTEPKDYEVCAFILEHYHGLEFSPAVEAEARQAADKPKRRQREAGKQMARNGIGTKSPAGPANSIGAEQARAQGEEPGTETSRGRTSICAEAAEEKGEA